MQDVRIDWEKEVIDLSVQEFSRHELPSAMLEAVSPFEERFHEEFDSFLYFSEDLLNLLHKPADEPTPLPSEVVVASVNDSTILSDMAVLKQVANSKILSVDMKRIFYDTLKTIYSKLPRQPKDLARQSATLCVGVEREGRILAEALGCMPDGRNLKPDAKRIPYEGGLIVGLSCPLIPDHAFDRCMIVDGAIASGSTIMAMIWLLRKAVGDFHVYSVHGPCEGLRAIVRFAKMESVNVSLTVGHATAGLNDKFYAIDPDDRKMLVVGDLGDTISDLNSPSRGHG